MNVELEELQKKIGLTVKRCFDNSFIPYSFVESCNNIKGQYWTLEIMICFNDNDNFIENVLYKIIRSDENRDENIDIINFFHKNDDFMFEIYRMLEKDYFNSLLQMQTEIGIICERLDNIDVTVGFTAKCNCEDEFKNSLLDEWIGNFEFKDNEISFYCDLEKRNCYVMPENGVLRKLLLPSSLAQYFPSAHAVNNFADINYKNNIENEEIYVFVLMSFQKDDNQMIDVFKTFERSVKKVYRKAKIDRVDIIEDDFKITEKIIECINKADFIIVDLTGERPNVYFELGYSFAKEKKTIRTARKGTILHFDIKDFNTIFWENVTELESHLVKRLIGIKNQNRKQSGI